MTCILIIEDNPANMKVFRMILKYYGYDVLEAFDGPAGISLAKSSHPDLILIDIQLPGMDGIEVLHHLQEYEPTRIIPKIAITSYAMKGDEEKLLSLGFTGYCSKPIRKDDFLQLIAATLKNSSTI
jgi:CheY-like chemotaxis protein